MTEEVEQAEKTDPEKREEVEVELETCKTSSTRTSTSRKEKRDQLRKEPKWQKNKNNQKDLKESHWMSTTKARESMWTS